MVRNRRCRAPVRMFRRMISVIPMLRMPRGARGVVVSALALAVGASSIVNACEHFIRFEREELGAFDGATEQMAPRSHVAALKLICKSIRFVE